MWMAGATINDLKKFLDAMDGQVNITVAQSEEYWQRVSRSRLAEGEDSCSWKKIIREANGISLRFRKCGIGRHV